VVNLLELKHAPVISACFASVVVVATVIDKLCNFQENWRNFRALAEVLDREKELYQYKIGDYAVAPEVGEKLLIERVEHMLASTTSQFLSIHRAENIPKTSSGSSE
jgi:hypothetical protein